MCSDSEMKQANQAVRGSEEIIRQQARLLNMRQEEGVRDRTRIARELHDTLLQSFQGLLLRFQTVSNLFPTGAAKQTLDGSIDQAAQAIAEGRDAVQGLRSSAVGTTDLAFAIRDLGDSLAARETNPRSAILHVTVEGKPRHLDPLLREEIYRIAAEALRNAFRHARAKQIEVEIRYDERQFRLRVRDDGKGIDSKLPSKDGWSGRYGLRGMRERAESMGGQLTIWSKPHFGTEVELRISTLNPYTASAPRRSWFDWKLRFAANSKT